MVTCCPSHTLSEAPTGREMCSEHVYASLTVGELAWQPSSGAALSLSFPSCKMDRLRLRHPPPPHPAEFLPAPQSMRAQPRPGDTAPTGH